MRSNKAQFPLPLWERVRERGTTRKKNISFAKTLRKNPTDTENLLWYHLRAKRFSDLKFRRQEPIGNYIVDFICHKRRIIIECDGGQHLLQAKQDQKRDNWLQNQGYKVIRFWDNEVLQNTSKVLEKIYEICQEPPLPSPLPQGEREF